MEPEDRDPWVVPNWLPPIMSFRFWKFALFAWTLTVETFTPSAEEAVRANEPMRWFETPFATFWLPSALFCAVVRLEAASARELPVTAPEEFVWLEVRPCKFEV